MSHNTDRRYKVAAKTFNACEGGLNLQAVMAAAKFSFDERKDRTIQMRDRRLAAKLSKQEDDFETPARLILPRSVALDGDTSLVSGQPQQSTTQKGQRT